MNFQALEPMSYGREQVKAPPELIHYATDSLLGVVFYLDSEDRQFYTNPDEIDLKRGFNCWQFGWYYEYLSGLVLPTYVWDAEKDFIPINKFDARWRDMVSYKERHGGNPIPHCGVMEDSETMIHCSRTTGGVARANIHRPPWASSLTNLVVNRHKSLL